MSAGGCGGCWSCNAASSATANEQLLNNWAAAPSDLADKLVDLSGLPDHQLLQALIQQDIGRVEAKAVLADSAIAELAKRCPAPPNTFPVAPGGVAG